MIRRSVRPDFAEPQAIADLERLCGPDGLLTVSTQEVLILLSWTRSTLTNHLKHHPDVPPRQSPVPKNRPKEWNEYFLTEVVAALKERLAWKQKQDALSARRQARVQGTHYAQWLNVAQLDDEWPMIQRTKGSLVSLFDGLGTIQRGDRVAWMTLEAILIHLAKQQTPKGD